MAEHETKPAAILLREMRHDKLLLELNAKLRELFKTNSVTITWSPWTGSSQGIRLVQRGEPDRDFVTPETAIAAVQAMIDAVHKERRDMKIYLGNLISTHPSFGKEWTVINIEILGDTMLLDLDDGTTIRLDIERYPRKD